MWSLVAIKLHTLQATRNEHSVLPKENCRKNNTGVGNGSNLPSRITESFRMEKISKIIFSNL